jgi:hypothetical protein
MRRGGSRSVGNAPRPDVIVDFHCSQGLLFISLKNIGEGSAYGVRTSFDKPLVGLGGEKTISEMQLFRGVEFVPPGKGFTQLLDPVAIWFQQDRPSRYTITITYSDREGNEFRERIVHNLDIYKDLGYISSGGIDGSPAD